MIEEDRRTRETFRGERLVNGATCFQRDSFVWWFFEPSSAFVDGRKIFFHPPRKKKARKPKRWKIIEKTMMDLHKKQIMRGLKYKNKYLQQHSRSSTFFGRAELFKRWLERRRRRLSSFPRPVVRTRFCVFSREVGALSYRPKREWIIEVFFGNILLTFLAMDSRASADTTTPSELTPTTKRAKHLFLGRIFADPRGQNIFGHLRAKLQALFSLKQIKINKSSPFWSNIKANSARLSGVGMFSRESFF